MDACLNSVKYRSSRVNSRFSGWFAGVLHKLDESVGKVVQALQDAGILQDSIVVFTTDNGGPAAGFNINAASNWPLRGVSYHKNYTTVVPVLKPLC
jgi:arylsulfatase A-like enzyme